MDTVVKEPLFSAVDAMYKANDTLWDVGVRPQSEGYEYRVGVAAWALLAKEAAQRFGVSEREFECGFILFCSLPARRDPTLPSGQIALVPPESADA
jgi:hypothetical protein